MNTGLAMEHMIKTQRWYTAAELGKELGVSAQVASGYLYNIRHNKSAHLEFTDIPNRKVRVISAWKEEATRTELWRMALFGRSA